MPTVDPNRPGYYTDGTPIPSTTGQSQQAGYPIGTNISGSTVPQDPAIAQQANAIRSASGTTQPIQRPGNPYDGQSSRVTYRTADNKISDSSNRNAYAYYGVPTSNGLAQGNEQYEFQEKLKQWAAEFEEQKRQNRFGNGISIGNLTGYYGDKKASVPSTGSYRAPTGGGYYVNGVLQ